MLVGCPGSIDHIAWQELSSGYIYHEPAGQPLIEKEYSGKGIPGLIFEYDFNNDFIIAFGKDVQLSEEKRNELITNGDLYDFVKKTGYPEYWIIVHANDSIYGPYLKEEYLQKREELNLPKALVLKEE